jgi:hypothetical protein
MPVVVEHKTNVHVCCPRRARAGLGEGWAALSAALPRDGPDRATGRLSGRLAARRHPDHHANAQGSQLLGIPRAGNITSYLPLDRWSSLVNDALFRQRALCHWSNGAGELVGDEMAFTMTSRGRVLAGRLAVPP